MLIFGMVDKINELLTELYVIIYYFAVPMLNKVSFLSSSAKETRDDDS